MHFKWKISNNFKLFIAFFLIILTILLILYEKQSYSKFDEKSWYDDNNISEKMTADMNNIDIEQVLRLKKLVRNMNTVQEVHNKDVYILNISLIIVIQVHDRVFFLEHLLQSLDKVKGVTKCMLIFSHDYFDNDTAAIIQNTYFTKYMQIFYPYNIQMHPRVFPGKDMKYCPRNMINCEMNVKYRDPEKAQLKHHWWWTVSTIFDKLTITRNYNGSILFLEEDQYVTEDLFYIIKLIEKVLPKIYPDFDLVALGPRFPSIKDYQPNSMRVIVEPWGLSENIAIIFNRTLWNKIRKLGEYFCNFDDYTWSNSLTYLSKHMTRGKLIVASVKSARVLRFEKCQYTEDSYCHEVEKVIGVQKFTYKTHRYLFPTSISLSIVNETVQPKIKILGNWRDVRDYELCMFYTSKTNFNTYKIFDCMVT